MLGLLWEAGLSRHLNSAGIGTNFEILYDYLRLICTGAPVLNSSTTGSRGNSKSPPPESGKSGKLIYLEIIYFSKLKKFKSISY